MKKIRLIFLAIFFIALTMPSFAFTKSECEMVLKMVAEELNKQCPQDFGEGVIMKDVRYSGSVLLMTLSCSEMNVQDFNSAADELKDAFLEGIFEEGAGEIILECLKGAGATMEIKFILAGGKTKSLSFTPRDLQRYLNNN